VDLQGVRAQHGWLLTDPCVLCDDTSRFGSGNLGPYAMERCCKGLSCLLNPPVPLAALRAGVCAPPNAWKGDAADRPLPVACASSNIGGVLIKGPLDVDAVIDQLLSGRGIRNKLVQVEEGQLRQLLTAARDTFLRQPSLLELQAPLKLLGDIHGQYQDLLRFFEVSGYPPDQNYLFLGDYVDRGKQSIETMALLLAYKIKYPENMFLLRGNHECSSITRIYGFYDECKRRYNIRLWKGFCDVFNCLPPAALVEDRILCMHGGLSPELSSLEDIRRLARPTDIPDTGLLCDLLWADPDKDVTGWCENDRGVSYIYGPDVLTQMNSRLGLDLIVRAHQVVEDGYEFFGDRQLVTLFSAPNYCGEFDNAAALLSLSDDLMCSFKILNGKSGKAHSGKYFPVVQSGSSQPQPDLTAEKLTDTDQEQRL